ncbi:MAG TPA: hypothetical protein VLX31_11685 [Streptosporangiaceae bacterium]|nr:hypothetical protein [Streptosporangiaceae bacterium]
MPDLDAKLGAHLRELAGLPPGADIAAVRQALASEISALAARLPADLREAILASLGISEPTRNMPRFTDRVVWLAAAADRTYRTALRRIDTAERLLAEEIARELQARRGLPDSDSRGWYLADLYTLFRVDTPTNEVHERRRIVATRDGLAEVLAWMDVPRDDGKPSMALEAEVRYGGRLVRRETPTRSRFHFMVKLPRPLRTGESHEYELILRAPAGDQMRSYYIFTPECRCDNFELRVRFDPEHLPGWTRRVDGEPVRVYEQLRPGAEHVPIDQAGEVHLQFTSPAKNLGYGLQWEPNGTAAGNGANGSHRLLAAY